MKKLFTLLFTMMLGFNVFAQCPITNAVDFTATDCHGTEINLFEILDGGQYVLIDFFFTTCGPCNQACPKIVEAYELLGCNQNEIFFMEISPNDNDAACQSWCELYGVEYPTIGSSSVGPQICSDYGIEYYPTCIIIAPDHTIVVNDIWPINDAMTIVNIADPFGIKQHDCDSGSSLVEITDISTTTSTVTATFNKSDECSSYYYMISTAAEMEMWVQMMQMPLETLVMQWGINQTETTTYTWTDMVPDTEYTIYVLPMVGDEMQELVTALATTAQQGGSGTSVVALEALEITSSSVRMIATPNEETSVYFYGLITVDYFNEIGEEQAVEIIRGNGYPLYGIDDWMWSGLDEATEYYAVSSGQNSAGEWGETTIISFVTLADGIDDNNLIGLTISPNPADGYVKVAGENINNVKIINMVGQIVYNRDVEGVETIISTEDFESGIYFVTINGLVTKKLVVR
ncbi:MAG: redoxin domain-containing protein [Candidatus Limimorpha sp.]